MIACLLVLMASPAQAQDATEYRELRAARPDGRSVPVNGLTLARDGYQVTLQSGAVHFLAPLGRDTFGAVFIGEGSYLLTPSTDAERRHLQLVTGSSDAFRDRFSQLVLLFTDETAAEIQAHAPVAAGSPDPAATRAYEGYLQRQRNDNLPNLHLRILSDLLNRPARTDGVFLAFVEGRQHAPVLLAVDPLGVSNLTTRFAFFGGEEVMLFSFNETNGGLWYSSAFASEAVGGRGKAIRMLADASHYDIDTSLDGSSLTGTTTITFTPAVDGLRVLPIHIFQRLQIRTATLEHGGVQTPAAVLQEEVSTGLFRRLFSDEAAAADVALQFPEPLARGEAVTLTIAYDGRDVVRGSEGVYAVGARESWYPNLGAFDDLATYAMTFRYPARQQLIAVGEQVSERTEGRQTIAVWRSQTPLRVAGFSYGDYQKTSREDAETGIGVDVYTYRGPSNFRSMAGTVIADAVNTSRLANAYFGAPEYRRLSMAQQPQLASGQSWPTLVYLPTISFASGSDFALGFSGVDPRALQSLKEFGNTVTWHEVAHQWWGHQVGWASYRDQWLSEGLAEFTAALMLEAASGRAKANAFWEQRRGEVLDRRTGVANWEAGAITQGFRLRTPRSPAAAQAMLYSKGAYVVHMLRMLMRVDRVPDPDGPFKAMMQDFAKTWAGRNPSTDDFQAVVERHMTRDMNLADDGTMNWFFDQWVHGTDIPTLTSSLDSSDLGGGRYRIAGTIAQAGVPDGFLTRVPIYLDLGNDRLERLGTLALRGSTAGKISVDVNIPARPRRVLINAMHDVLTR